MPPRFLSARDLWIWGVSFALVSALLYATGFASDDPDSALYANISARLAEGPVSRWIAPEWWGNWDSDGLFREHPAGVYFLPTALASLGFPAVPSAYVVGIALGLASLLLIGHLVTRICGAADGRAAIVLLQLMPVAFLFRIRANHEYPMLLCLLLTLVALDGVRQSWRWLPVVAVALTAALLVKGVFVLLIFVAAGLWILINPSRERGPNWRPIAACVAAIGVMAGVAYVYDVAYLRLTGETFWWHYWHRQMAPLSVATPLDDALTLARHAGFYLVRLLWHPAPWSFALAIAAWRARGQLIATWRGLPDPSRRGLLFAVAFAALSIGVLSPASRFAERYAFSASYAIATAGAVIALRLWPRFASKLSALDAVVPALPALLWLGLMVGRVVLGPFVPRI
ncbi:MAG TPA: glycosyltransferase family 39 protein [Vicinamibacterales bacterium]|nr:glycosyltransferase family 39 protein [Vicinamibacterales bacterium]